MHHHGPRIEISYLASGQQTYIMENERYDMVGGDVLVTKPYETHGTGPHPENRGEMYWMILSAQTERGRFLDLPPAQGRTLLNELMALEPRHFLGRAGLKTILQQVFALYNPPLSLIQKMNIKNLLLRYLLDVLACAGKKQPHGPSTKIDKAQQYMADHLGELFTMDEVAKRAGLSLSRFKARFKKEVGLPPGEWLARQRIEKAIELLQHTDQPITRIAHNLGFSTSQYFATVFKRYTGKKPSVYRQNQSGL